MLATLVRPFHLVPSDEQVQATGLFSVTLRRWQLFAERIRANCQSSPVAKAILAVALAPDKPSG